MKVGYILDFERLGFGLVMRSQHPLPNRDYRRHRHDQFRPNKSDIVAERSHGGTPGWTFLSAGKPNISESDIESGTRSNCPLAVVTCSTIASTLTASPVIFRLMRRDKPIRLSARLKFKAIPVTTYARVTEKEPKRPELGSSPAPGSPW
jgi:hypothetical protein